jgi:hypothetical protein
VKCLRRLAAVQKPLLCATASIDRSLTSRRRCASWTRWRTIHWYGVVPVAPMNRRANVRGLMAERAARSSIVTGSSRCSCTHAKAAVKRSESLSGGKGFSMYCAWPPSRWGGNHQLPGKHGGDLAAIVLADDMETQINAGDTARTGKDVALVKEEHTGVDRQPRVAASKFVAVRPVSNCTSSVEQSRLGEDKCTRAQ